MGRGTSFTGQDLQLRNNRAWIVARRHCTGFCGVEGTSLLALPDGLICASSAVVFAALVAGPLSARHSDTEVPTVFFLFRFGGQIVPGCTLESTLY